MANNETNKKPNQSSNKKSNTGTNSTQQPKEGENHTDPKNCR